jgi:hypothetical protein
MSNAIYSDCIVTSSELNRRSGQILDTALTTPVTITRNNDSFALIRRELMTNMAKGIEQMNNVTQLVNIVYRLTSGQEIESTSRFKWVEEFDSEERSELVNEVYEALELAKSTDDWDEVRDIIHEWHESAIATKSEELSEAFGK